MTIARAQCVQRHVVPGVAVSLRRVRRQPGRRRGRPRDDAGARRRRRRDRVRVGERPDRARADVECAPQRADGVARARAGLPRDDDRRRGSRVRARSCDRACAATRSTTSDLRGGIVGHVGDGNFHVAFLLDPDDAASIAQAEALNRASSRTRSLAAAHAPASTGSATESSTTSRSSTATCCRSCAASRICSTRTGS